MSGRCVIREGTFRSHLIRKLGGSQRRIMGIERWPFRLFHNLLNSIGCEKLDLVEFRVACSSFRSSSLRTRWCRHCIQSCRLITLSSKSAACSSFGPSTVRTQQFYGVQFGILSGRAVHEWASMHRTYTYYTCPSIKEYAPAAHCFVALLIFDPWDGGDTFLWNVGTGVISQTMAASSYSGGLCKMKRK
jgi:hypothetical protein